MATTYTGDWVGSSFKGRLVVEVSDIPVITSDTGNITITSNWYAEFSAKTWDGGASFDTNGSFDAAPVTVAIGSSSNTVTRWHMGTRTISIAPMFGSQYGIQVAGTYTGVNNIGSGTVVSINTWFNVPAKPYKKPLAPANYSYGLTATRQATNYWSGNYTGSNGAYPWSNVQIERWDNVGGWKGVAQLGWDAVNWVDSGLIDDRSYQYRTRASGPGGVSDWATFNATLYTKPAAPSNVIASKDASGNIVVSWTNNSTIANRWEVWRFVDGVQESAQAVVWGTTYTHNQPDPAKTYAYEIIALAPDDTRSDRSPRSGTVQLLTTPNAPTNLTPSGVALNRATAHTRTWQHNPRDGSPQSAYEIQTRTSTDGGTTWGTWTTSGKVTSATSSRSVAAHAYAVDTVIEWQVRTWGGYTSPSGWSAIHRYAVNAVPVATITSPTASQQISTDLVTMTWSYTGSAIQASYVATLIAAGQVGETRTGNGTGTSVAFAYRLANNTNYTLELTVTDANGLPSSKVTRSFSTKFIGPPAAQGVATWDDGHGTVTLSLSNPTPGTGIPEAVSTIVERKVGTAYYSLGTYGLDATLTDPIPTQGTATYRLTTLSSLGASTTSEVTVPTPNRGDWIWVNYGAAFMSKARVRLDAQTSSKLTRERARHSFAGRKRPVTYVGDTRDFTITVSALTEEIDTLGNRQAWWRAADEADLVCYRDHLGRRIFGSMEGVAFDQETDDLSVLTFEIQEDDHAE